MKGCWLRWQATIHILMVMVTHTHLDTRLDTHLDILVLPIPLPTPLLPIHLPIHLHPRPLRIPLLHRKVAVVLR